MTKKTFLLRKLVFPLVSLPKKNSTKCSTRNRWYKSKRKHRMMKLSYFPGCTLKTKAKELDIYTRKCALALGVELEEIEDWQCCGGVFTTASDEIATKLSSIRALLEAREKVVEELKKLKENNVFGLLIIMLLNTCANTIYAAVEIEKSKFFLLFVDNHTVKC